MCTYNGPNPVSSIAQHGASWKRCVALVCAPCVFRFTLAKMCILHTEWMRCGSFYTEKHIRHHPSIHLKIGEKAFNKRAAVAAFKVVATVQLYPLHSSGNSTSSSSSRMLGGYIGTIQTKWNTRTKVQSQKLWCYVDVWSLAIDSFSLNVHAIELASFVSEAASQR